MKRKYTAIAVMLILAFTMAAVGNIVRTDRTIKLRDVQSETTNSELQKNLLETERLNQKAEKLRQDHTTTEQQNKQLQQQLDQQIEKNQQLERELSIKREAQRIAKEHSQEVASLSAKASAATTDPNGWMATAGIPQTDWYYVSCVINGCDGVSAEGGWSGVLRWNTSGSGAYGLCQALPASKMASAGADYMTNPITQLKWCHSYAQGYGGWAAAWKFRACVGSCYSPRTNTTVHKVETWW